MQKFFWMFLFAWGLSAAIDVNATVGIRQQTFDLKPLRERCEDAPFLKSSSTREIFRPDQEIIPVPTRHLTTSCRKDTSSIEDVRYRTSVSEFKVGGVLGGPFTLSRKEMIARYSWFLHWALLFYLFVKRFGRRS